jgi:hypothetical protein
MSATAALHNLELSARHEEIEEKMLAQSATSRRKAEGMAPGWGAPAS